MKLVIIPVKDEEGQKLKELAHDLCDKGMRVLIVEDHSKEPLAFPPLNDRYVIENKFEAGKGSALKFGIIYAGIKWKLNDSDLVVVMDGDGQIDPKELDTFFRLMELYDADAVIGNKRHLFSVTMYGTVRRIVSQTYNFIVRMLFGFNYRDTQCGIKVFKRSALCKVISLCEMKRYAFDLELIVALRANEFRVVDAPVRVKKQNNLGSVSFRSILQTFIDTVKIYAKLKKGRYNHG